LGKIANALGKYNQERKAVRLPKLTRADWVALLSYNRKTGHLLNPDTDPGKPGNHSMEALKKRGTIQRLLAHKLIFPGGKLTAKGLSECERLKKRIQGRKLAVDNDKNINEKTIVDSDGDDVIIELKEKAEPVDPSGAIKTPPTKVVPMLKRLTSLKPESTPQPEIEEVPVNRPPMVKETVVEHGKQGSTTDEDTNTAAVPDLPDKMEDEKVEEDRSPVSMPDVSFDGKRLSKKLVSLVEPQSYEAEQFKMLRNSILFPVAGAAPRSILITSCLPAEGKSFVSANLAVSIAMNVNKHVLLIDCDLRKPDLHRIFGFGDMPGLSDFLAERRSLDSLLVKTTVDKLTLLPGGPVPSNPSELASSQWMSAMLEEVKYRYQDRLIVIDSPPPGLAAETSFLARQVDGILLVVKYGKTPKEDVEDLMETVGSDKILGVVINYLDMPLSRRYGYGKYGKYSRYGRYGNYGREKK
jgi:exopolysaccharide/PEP-CTERM locus tyrosine autokinase